MPILRFIVHGNLRDVNMRVDLYPKEFAFKFKYINQINRRQGDQCANKAHDL